MWLSFWAPGAYKRLGKEFSSQRVHSGRPHSLGALKAHVPEDTLSPQLVVHVSKSSLEGQPAACLSSLERQPSQVTLDGLNGYVFGAHMP